MICKNFLQWTVIVKLCYICVNKNTSLKTESPLWSKGHICLIEIFCWILDTFQQEWEKLLKNYLNLSVIWSRTLKWRQTSTLSCFPQCKYSTLSTMLFQHARYYRVQMLHFMSTKQYYPVCRKLRHCMVIPRSLCLSKEGCCKAKLSCHLLHSAILLHSLQGQQDRTCTLWSNAQYGDLLHKNCCAYRGDSTATVFKYLQNIVCPSVEYNNLPAA